MPPSIAFAPSRVFVSAYKGRLAAKPGGFCCRACEIETVSYSRSNCLPPFLVVPTVDFAVVLMKCRIGIETYIMCQKYHLSPSRFNASIRICDPIIWHSAYLWHRYTAKVDQRHNRISDDGERRRCIAIAMCVEVRAACGPYNVMTSKATWTILAIVAIMVLVPHTSIFSESFWEMQTLAGKGHSWYPFGRVERLRTRFGSIFRHRDVIVGCPFRGSATNTKRPRVVRNGVIQPLRDAFPNTRRETLS